ncbi:MAG: hypothetical protein GWM98_04670 [Nitrospinaceae bacterium]|nr:hypothetical protein [Deltaproteobacteria bacterium]NIY14213.1 hypothetical protein [Nitrospinaceae bacterium]
MPIDLTADFDPGDADSGSYTHVGITAVQVRTEDKVIQFTTKYGTYPGSVFTPGVNIRGVTVKTFDVTGADYDSIVAELCSSTSAKVYDEVARLLYEWLISEGHFAGTVV